MLSSFIHLIIRYDFHWPLTFYLGDCLLWVAEKSKVLLTLKAHHRSSERFSKAWFPLKIAVAFTSGHRLAAQRYFAIPLTAKRQMVERFSPFDCRSLRNERQSTATSLDGVVATA